MSLSEIPEPDVSEQHPISEHWVWVGSHRPPCPRALFDQMTQNWGEVSPSDRPHPMAPFCNARRRRLREQLAGRSAVIPSGGFKVRANDTDYRFRPGTDFYYLTGCEEPDAVLVLFGDGRDTLYVAPRRDQRTHEFFTDARYGELWVGARRGVDEAALHYGIDTAPLDYLAKDLSSLEASQLTLVRGFDATLDAAIAPSDEESELVESLSRLRLIKDDFEIAQLELAVEYTVRGFHDVVRALPEARGRSERIIEGIFNLRARYEGNDVGYNTIAASGANATVLHWTTNDGRVRDGDLLLLDAGVECQYLYTADVTRTMPINGHFSDAQRRIYDLVRVAQQAGVDAVAPGASFHAPHDAAMRVLAEGLHELGILRTDPEESLRKDRQLHRRYTLHGTSHMLGLDVHDCANARNEEYFGELAAGYVLTVEPGLYFQPHDLTVPEEYRGIGVRIEDDILVTESGARNLSEALPREPEAIESWMAGLFEAPAPRLGLSSVENS